MMLFTDQFRHVLSASDLSLDLLMLRARVYTENYIGVHIYENYGMIVGGSYVYRLAIVQRLFNDRKTETERELSYDRYCTCKQLTIFTAQYVQH